MTLKTLDSQLLTDIIIILMSEPRNPDRHFALTCTLAMLGYVEKERNLNSQTKASKLLVLINDTVIILTNIFFQLIAQTYVERVGNSNSWCEPSKTSVSEKQSLKLFNWYSHNSHEQAKKSWRTFCSNLYSRCSDMCLPTYQEHNSGRIFLLHFTGCYIKKHCSAPQVA